MLGDGMVSFGVPLVTDFRKAKSSAKMVSLSFKRSLIVTPSAAKGMSPATPWNCTVTFSSARATPPMR